MAAEQQVDERDQRDEHQQHRDDVEQELQSFERAARERSDGVGVLTRQFDGRRGVRSPGTSSTASAIATGVAANEASNRWPSACGTTGASTWAYSTSTVPAIVAMPQFMTMNSSLRDNRARYGRTTSGASTMPTNTFAAAETPTAPPTPTVRSSSHAKPRTTSGRMRQ